MMQRLTRQKAIALGLTTCYGSVCKQHPELEGLRRVSGACVNCAKNHLQKSRQQNPEKTAAQRHKDYAKLIQNPGNAQKKKQRDLKYFIGNKEKCYKTRSSWLDANPGKQQQYSAKHRDAHPDAKNADTAKRRADKLLRTPNWLSKDDWWIIRQAYELAAMRTKMFGFKWHVDHVLPLRGKIVSGLHVPTNLQVIPAQENIRKGNRVVQRQDAYRSGQLRTKVI